jgi:hypothetical protein
MVQLPRHKVHGCVIAFSMLGALFAVQCGGDDTTENAPPPDSGFDSSNPGLDSGSNPGLDSGSPELTGQSCTVEAECYPALDGATLQGGAAVCLSHILGGYCTHVCTKDEDCCALPGECRTALRQVCAPFESTGQMLCFLSCEDRDIRTADAGADVSIPTDPATYCQAEVAADFGCRSTGGGAENRKVCIPGAVGPDATTDAPTTITMDGSPADATDGPAPDAVDGSGTTSDASDAATE